MAGTEECSLVVLLASRASLLGAPRLRKLRGVQAPASPPTLPPLGASTGFGRRRRLHLKQVGPGADESGWSPGFQLLPAGAVLSGS